jgi:ABC-type hemin transport system substrate-binding protein
MGIGCCAPKSTVESKNNGQEFRIATLSPSISLILQQLGLEDNIVGRHGFDIFLDKSVPVVGDQAGLDYEQLARVAPTHILLEWGSRDLPERLQTLAAKQGWIVNDFTLLQLDDLFTTIDALGNTFDRQADAEELLTTLRDALSPMEQIPDAFESVLPLYWTSPIGVAGPGSFHAEILERLGLPLAIQTGHAYIEMESEDLARLDPSVIILFVPNAEDSYIADAKATLAALNLSAAAMDRIIFIDDPTCLSLSAQIASVANQIRERIDALSFD